MAQRPVKFIWGSSEQINGEWHAGLWGWYDRRPGLRHSGLAISVRGLLRWAAGLGVGLYLAAAVVLYFTLKRNPYNQVTFTDTVLLPLRWSHVREVRGRMLIAEGLDDLKQKRWAEAAMKLRAGLARAPHDLRARLALAQFYLVANRRVNALTLLTEDLGHGYPGRTYLETLFAMAAEGEDYDVIVTTCDRFKAETADRAWLRTQKLLALARAHRAEDVLKLVDAASGEVGREVKVNALLELGRPAEALAELGLWEQQTQPSLPLVRRLQVRALREAGRLAEMDAAMTSYRETAPTDPRAHVYIVVQQWLAGRREEATRMLEDFFRRYAGAAQNLVVALKATAEAKATPLVQRCADEAVAHGFVGKGFKSALVEAQLEAGDWNAAVRTLAELKALIKQPSPGEAFALDWMTRLLTATTQPDEAAQSGLLQLFQQRPVSMRIYRETCEALVLAQRFVAARRVLELAERTYPSSATLAASRARVEEALRPPPPVATAAVPLPPPISAARAEQNFFDEIAAAQREQRWTDAAQAIREVRVAKPAWFAARETDVLELQIRVAAKAGDALELLAAARLHLDGSNARATRLLAIARELAAGGDRGDGVRLLQEVLRKHPDFPPALRLKAEWEPKAPAEKPAAGPKTAGRTALPENRLGG